MDEHQKTLFEACVRQAEFFNSRWDARRKYEWGTTIAVWALLAGGATLVKQIAPWQLTLALVAEMLALLFCYAIFWLRPIWRANELDQRRSRFYQKQAEAIMHGATPSGDQPEDEDERDSAFFRDWSMRFQFLSVAILAAVFFTIPRPPEKTPALQPVSVTGTIDANIKPPITAAVPAPPARPSQLKKKSLPKR